MDDTSMTKLVFYASTGGNAEAAAKYIASKIEGEAVPIDMASKADLGSADTVVFGSRVHVGSIHKSITEFIAENKEALGSKKQAYFLTCMYKGEKGDSQCAKVGQQLGIGTGAYFNGIKKKIKAGETSELDAFIDRINAAEPGPEPQEFEAEDPEEPMEEEPAEETADAASDEQEESEKTE